MVGSVPVDREPLAIADQIPYQGETVRAAHWNWVKPVEVADDLACYTEWEPLREPTNELGASAGIAPVGNRMLLRVTRNQGTLALVVNLVT